MVDSVCLCVVHSGFIPLGMVLGAAYLVFVDIRLDVIASLPWVNLFC